MIEYYTIKKNQFTSNLIEIGLDYDVSEYYKDANKKFKDSLIKSFWNLSKNQREQQPAIDLDFYCALLNSSSKLINKDYFVFFNSVLTNNFLDEPGKRPISFDGSLYGVYDDLLQNELSPDYDGTLHLVLDQTNINVDEIKIFVSIWPEGQANHNGQVKFGSKCNFIITLRDYFSKKVLFKHKYKFGFMGFDTIELGTFIRKQNEWLFYANGKCEIGGMKKIIDTYL